MQIEKSNPPYIKYEFGAHLWDNPDGSVGVMFKPQNNNWGAEIEIAGTKILFQQIASVMMSAIKKVVEKKKGEEIEMKQKPDNSYTFDI